MSEMVKKFLLLCLSILLMPSLTIAATSFRIDMDANTPGLQTDIWLNPGESFTSNIEVVLDGSSDSLTAFGYSLWWDVGELNTPVAGDISTFALGAGWADFGYGNISSPYIYNFSQGNVAEPPNGFSEGSLTSIVATINWTAWNPMTDGSDTSLGFYSGLDSVYDKNYNLVTPTFQGGTINLAPEPISSILFITGGTLLAGRRFLGRGQRYSQKNQ